MSFELVPYTEIRALLGLEKADISDYPSLEVINDRLLESIEEFLQRELELIERVETIFTHNTPTQMVLLKGLPVASVASVSVVVDGGATALSSGDYYETDYGIKLYSKITNAKIVVTYTGGLAAVTGKIKAAALYQLAYEFQSKEQIGAISISTDGGYVNRPELGLLKETERMLKSSIHPMKL